LSESEIHRRIKEAIAKELMYMGYSTGIEVQRKEGGRFDVYATKGNETISVEIWNTHLPDWIGLPDWVIRIQGESRDRRSYLNENQNSDAPYLDPTVNLGILYGKPHSEVSKLKIFIEIFNALSGQDRNEVSELNFIEELIRTTKFSEDEAKTYIQKAIRNGQIYERESGYLAKA
jgi:hypothetical protein